jgi:hypothetical protein
MLLKSLQDFNKPLSYAQPKGAYCSFLGTFEDLKKPYPTEFGLPYVVLASTTASSNFQFAALCAPRHKPSCARLCLRATKSNI